MDAIARRPFLGLRCRKVVGIRIHPESQIVRETGSLVPSAEDMFQIEVQAQIHRAGSPSEPRPRLEPLRHHRRCEWARFRRHREHRHRLR